jgi:spore coat polysaccharide biosynthesis predicted glycosyltransferase SpsG
MTRIFFRCDGGTIPEIGMGHVARCLLLADNLNDENKEISFIMKDYKEGIEKVKEKGYKIFAIKLTEDENEEVIKIIEKFTPDIIIFDKLNNDISLLKRINNFNIVIATLDDKGNKDNYSDIRINAIIPADNPKTLNLYQGSDYIVLPSYETSPKSKIINEVNKIFISFGGYDHLNITNKTLRSLESIDNKIELNVIIGLAYPKKEELNKFLNKYRHQCNLYVNPSNFNELLDQADIAIISGGLTLYQALSRGIPSIVISQYDHQ